MMHERPRTPNLECGQSCMWHAPSRVLEKQGSILMLIHTKKRTTWRATPKLDCSNGLIYLRYCVRDGDPLTRFAAPILSRTYLQFSPSAPAHKRLAEVYRARPSSPPCGSGLPRRTSL